MARWESRFNGHPLWTSLTELRTKLDEYELPEDEPTRETIEYASGVERVASSRKRSTPAIMVTPAMLDNSDAAVRNLISGLAQLDEDEPQLPVVDASTDAVVATFFQWPAPSPEDVTEAVSAQLTALAEKTDALIAGLAAKRDELAAQQAALVAEQTALTTRIGQTEDANSKVVASFTKSSDAALEQKTNEWNDSRSAADANANKLLDSLADWEQKAEQVVHRTTGVATATDFGNYARQQGIVAGFFDFFAGLVGIAGVTALIVHLYQVGESNSDVGLSLTRLAASLGTLGIAGIIGARAGQHHHEARLAKRTDLTLRRIEPFTANLDPDT
ncbi:MAG: hypothetical protein ACJ72L_11655, partial [Marmoricola sp.]